MKIPQGFANLFKSTVLRAQDFVAEGAMRPGNRMPDHCKASVQATASFPLAQGLLVQLGR